MVYKWVLMVKKISFKTRFFTKFEWLNSLKVEKLKFDFIKSEVFIYVNVYAITVYYTLINCFKRWGKSI